MTVAILWGGRGGASLVKRFETKICFENAFKMSKSHIFFHLRKKKLKKTKFLSIFCAKMRKIVS